MLRGQNPGGNPNAEKLGLPIRPFLYTLDQIATILSMDEKHLRRDYMFYDGRSTGSMSVHLLLCRNIAHPTKPPEWRVAEKELLRWLKKKGFRVYELQVVTH